MKRKVMRKLFSMLLVLCMVFSILPSSAIAAGEEDADAQNDVDTTYSSDYSIRALFVDAGRKYFSVDWFKSIIDEMASNNMNTLYISFSNDEGFRLLLDDMGLSFDDGSGNTVEYDQEFMAHLVENPQNLSDSDFLKKQNEGAVDVCQGLSNWDSSEYLTQTDMREIVGYAQASGIKIIPELNSPGHMGQILWYFPTYRNVGTWGIDNGPSYALNLENKEAVNFATALIEKYVDFFLGIGCTDFCIGGDEFAANGSSTETIATYLNNLASYVKSKNMTAYAWNDGQAVGNGLSTDVVINCWNGDPTSILNNGYKVVNFNSNALYYVLKSYEWKPNLSGWTPLTFNGATVDENENILGASLAIWCDDANRETAEEIKTNITSYFSDFSAALASSEEDSDLPAPTQGAGYELVNFASPTVSTNASSGWYYDGGNVIDGDTGTYAWTNGAQDVGTYIRVDLGEVQTVTSITVTSPADGDTCTNANVQVSTDGTTWTTIGTHSGSSSESVTDSYKKDAGNMQIRYIQIVITEAKNNWWKVSEISWDPKATDTIEDGTYIIVNGTNQAMNTNASGSGLGNSTVTIENSVATPVDSTYEWTFTQQDDGTYYITNASGEYLYISNNGVSVSSTPQNITATISGGKVQLSNGNNAINYYASNGQIFSRWNSGTSDSNNMHTLYKKIESIGVLATLSLYNAIIEARSYSNDDGRYGAEEFSALQTELESAINVYLSAYEESTETTQEQIDEAEASLRAAINALILSDTTSSYIEIPIEILDFRADGVLFEYDQNATNLGAYDLLKPWASAYENLLPGTPASQEEYADDDVWRRQGLTESTLVDGNLVYTQATVEYVAALINAGYYSDLTGTEDSCGDWKHSTVINWNTTISEKVNAVKSIPGSWTDTLAKTSTGTNGGYLNWSNIATSTDLAYYLLTNLYRSTTGDGNATYNTPVSDVNKLRMLYDENTGLYTIDARYQTETTGNYLYNTDLTTGTSNSPGKFDPINGLGYEGSDYEYGDTTDAVDGENFHFTMHANGSFVYYADQNLYFEFAGDDDVYFYINGKLAMDIGGAHGSCADKLYLNDVADELGLVDGGIYSFDMFYAERHTTASNLRFATNIQIMDTEAVTTKGQYNAETGNSIDYGAIVEAGTNVAYSFNVLNLRSVPIKNISFVDDTLGSKLSGNSITLYDSDKTNGAITVISDIIVYYHTYDRPSPTQDGTLNSDTPVEKTVAEITDMIEAANGDTESTSLERGSYKVAINSEDELKQLLVLGAPVDTQLCVYGIKRTVMDTDTPYINTVSSRAYYTSNGKNIAINGRANQKLTVLNSFASIEKEQIVIDYGKAINIDIANITDNLTVRSSATRSSEVVYSFYGVTKNGAHTNVRTNTTGIRTELNTEFTPANGNGTYQLLDSSEDNKADVIQFQLTKMLSEVEKVYAVYEVKDSALSDSDYVTYYILVEVDIIPATNVYYETDFADKVFTFATTGTDWKKVTVDGDNNADGPQDDGTVGQNQYGYDSSYADDKYQSDDSSWKVIGAGSTSTTVNFSFTGTGFDIISRTGQDEGFIRVSVYSDAEKTNLAKRVTVLNKSESDLTLYQIPVVSIENLDYGTYYVEIGVSAPNTTSEYKSLQNNGQFHFDAIRIYNPINASASAANMTPNSDAGIAYMAYVADGEANPSIKEVRSMLIAANTFDETADAEDTDYVEGVSFVDKNQEGVKLSDYKTIGPNNEVYLTGDQAIGFKIQVDGTTLPASIDIGAKSANGEAVVLHVSVLDADFDEIVGAGTGDEGISISSCTAQYFNLMGSQGVANVFGSNNYVYVVIDNLGDGVLSITDLKIGSGNETASVQILSDQDVVEQTINYVEGSNAQVEEANYDILSAEFTTETVKRNKDAIIKVKTSDDVETLKVQNSAGRDVSIKTSIKENGDGTKDWTITFKATSLGTQKYTVTGYGADGTAGESATVSIKVTAR